MAKLTENKARKREAILTAARDTFLSEGYVATKMDDIARTAGVTKQTVYRYFPSKSVLFQAVLEWAGNHADFDFLTHLKNPNLLNAIKDFSSAFLRAHLSPHHLGTYRLLISEGEMAPEIREIFCDLGPNTVHEAVTDFLAKRLELAEPDMTFRLWIAMLLEPRGRVLMGVAPPDEAALETHIHAVNRLMFPDLFHNHIQDS